MWVKPDRNQPVTDEKPRWKYRFDNYQRAFGLLREAIETMQARDLTQLEKALEDRP